MLFAALILARVPVQYIDKSEPSPNTAFESSLKIKLCAEASQVQEVTPEVFLNSTSPSALISNLDVKLKVSPAVPDAALSNIKSLLT